MNVHVLIMYQIAGFEVCSSTCELVKLYLQNKVLILPYTTTSTTVMMKMVENKKFNWAIFCEN